MKRLLYIFVILGVFCSIVEAQRSGGGFRSSSPSSSPSRSYSSPSRSYSTPSTPRSSGGFRSPQPSSSKPSSKQSTESPRSSGGFKSSSSTSTVTPSKPKSSVDSALFNKTKESGVIAHPRSEQINKFKAEYASKYTSKYPNEPKTRPSHIPTTYSENGKNYNITYNSNYGGYGYWSGGPGLGTFILYDVMRDSIMLSALTNNHGYITTGEITTSGVTHVQYYPSFLSVFILIFCLILLVGTFYVITK